MIALLIAAGILEGFGIISILPILSLTIGDNNLDSSVISQIVSRVLSSIGLYPNIETLLIVIASVILAKAFFHLLAMKQVGYTVANVATDLRFDLINSLLKAQWKYFTSLPVGKLATAISTEATVASHAYWAACLVFSLSIQVMIYLFTALLVSVKVTLAALFVGIIMALSVSYFIKLTRLAGQRQINILNSLVARFTDGISGIKPLKAMALEERLSPLLSTENIDLKSALKRHVISREALTALQEPIAVFFLCIGIYWVKKRWNMNFSEFMVLVFLFYRIVTRIGSIQMSYQNMTASEYAFVSIENKINTAKQNKEKFYGSSIPTFENGIHLKQIDFGYDNRPVLSKINLEISTSGIIAIVGPSGAGKSTLIDIITGLIRPDSGEIYIDNFPLNKYDIMKWRSLIGYVPQEMFLFHDTVKQNITLGDSCYTENDCKTALEEAGALSFIEDLPEGLNTVVGEKGSKLSGGQRQRIALARALIKNPKLLILDEATSALDLKTENEILTKIKELSKSISILAISHRQTLIDFADETYNLKNCKLKKAPLQSEKFGT